MVTDKKQPTNNMNTIKKLLLLAVLTAATTIIATGCTCMSGKCKPNASAQAKPYPLNYCLVSGDKLGDMGKTYTTNYMGQEITFCCKDCVKDFNQDPKKYMQKLADAESQNSLSK